jgi:hypothetical protein
LEVIPFVVLPLGALPNGRIWEGIKVFLALAGFLVQLPGALANYKWNELTSELDAGMFTGNIRHILRGEIDSWVFRHLGPVTFAGLLAFSVFLFFRIRRQMRAAGRDRRFCGPLSG